MPITVILELRLKPESVPAAHDVMRRALQDTRAFDGNLGTDVLVDQDDEAHQRPILGHLGSQRIGNQRRGRHSAARAAATAWAARWVAPKFGCPIRRRWSPGRPARDRSNTRRRARSMLPARV